jgi:hypothetical protein
VVWLNGELALIREPKKIQGLVQIHNINTTTPTTTTTARYYYYANGNNSDKKA